MIAAILIIACSGLVYFALELFEDTKPESDLAIQQDVPSSSAAFGLSSFINMIAGFVAKHFGEPVDAVPLEVRLAFGRGDETVILKANGETAFAEEIARRAA